MSGGDGARVSRGMAAHSAKEFALVGAVYFSSILPGRLEPQDRSRTIHLQLGSLPALANPFVAAQRLEALEVEARRLGPRIVRRMLAQSPRWDATHRFYRALVLDMGGEPRDGDTIGTVLTGWDLMNFEHVSDGSNACRDRVERARAIIRPLLREAVTAREEGEGERCLRHLLIHHLQLPLRGAVSIGELIAEAIQHGASSPDLDRHGLRYRPGQSDLLIASGQHKALYAVFRGTRWSDGGHVEAMLSLEAAERPGNPLTPPAARRASAAYPSRATGTSAACWSSAPPP